MSRVLDVLLSGVAIFVLFPLLLPIAVLLLLTGEHEIFFLQERIGKKGKKFQLIKFATMLKNSPNIGTGTVTIADDPRVLPTGKILRKTKLNELPQLLNVFLGHMSLIGPRPLTVETFSMYSPTQQAVIYSVRPGLSGIGSIIFRDEERLLVGKDDPLRFYEKVIAPYKAELEAWYTNNRSFYLNFIFIIITIYVIVKPKSNIVWKLFPEIPEPPEDIKDKLTRLK